MEVIDAFVRPIVADALRRKGEKAAAGEEGEEEETLLGHLVELTDGGSSFYSANLPALITSLDDRCDYYQGRDPQHPPRGTRYGENLTIPDG